VDEDGRVEQVMGGPLPRLFAVGNVAAAWIGSGYGGRGSPLGIVLTGGYRARLAAAAPSG
jgi:3-oxosteroid 1-dehydrogenase